MADDGDFKFRMEVEGLAAAIKAIGKFDPELRKQIVRDMKNVASPMVADARARIPAAPPLSNWGDWPGGVGWNAALFKRRTAVTHRSGASRDEPGVIPLLTLRNDNPAFTGPFEMAGRLSKARSPQGHAFVRNLDAGFGQASRTLWPAAEAHERTVTVGLEKIIDTVSAEIERAY